MDALVHLSLREGLPRALPQALAAGKPVIAYDCDGAREVCLEDETGFLVPPGDLLAWINCLDCSRDDLLREQLGSTRPGLCAAKILPSKKWWKAFTIFI